VCNDCIDNDADSLVDLADPDCPSQPLELVDGTLFVSATEGVGDALSLVGSLPSSAALNPAQEVVVVSLDTAIGLIFCAQIPAGQFLGSESERQFVFSDFGGAVPTAAGVDFIAFTLGPTSTQWRFGLLGREVVVSVSDSSQVTSITTSVHIGGDSFVTTTEATSPAGEVRFSPQTKAAGR
jgi:hypothetical protein